jgi:hypothetical protein
MTDLCQPCSIPRVAVTSSRAKYHVGAGGLHEGKDVRPVSAWKAGGSRTAPVPDPSNDSRPLAPTGGSPGPMPPTYHCGQPVRPAFEAAVAKPWVTDSWLDPCTG